MAGRLFTRPRQLRLGRRRGPGCAAAHCLAHILLQGTAVVLRIGKFRQSRGAADHPQRGRDDADSDARIALFQADQGRDRHAQPLRPHTLRLVSPDPGDREVLAQIFQCLGSCRWQGNDGLRGFWHNIDITLNAYLVKSINSFWSNDAHQFGELDLNKVSKRQHLECKPSQNTEIGTPLFNTTVRHLMSSSLASRIMRTTIDIDAPILQELKLLQQQQGKSLGRLVSDLLAQALAQSGKRSARKPAFHWVCAPMNSRVDLADKHALLDAMDTAAP